MHTHTYIYTYIPSTAAEKRARILPEPRAGRQRATTESDALFPPASAQFRPPSSPMVTLRKTRLPPAYAVSAAPRHPCRRRPRAAPPAFRRRAPPRPAGRWMVGQADSRWTAIVDGGREMTATLTCISTWSSSAAFSSQVRRIDCSSIILSRRRGFQFASEICRNLVFERISSTLCDWSRLGLQKEQGRWLGIGREGRATARGAPLGRRRWSHEWRYLRCFCSGSTGAVAALPRRALRALGDWTRSAAPQQACTSRRAGTWRSHPTTR